MGSVTLAHNPDAVVLSKIKTNLAETVVEDNPAKGPGLQQAGGKTAGRSTHIETDLVIDLHLPMFERTFEFKATAANIFQIFPEQANCRFRSNLGAGLLQFLIVD